MDIQSGSIVVLAFGFFLGLKHATDADHVVAVANIVGKENKVWQSVWIGASWGIGHSIPLLVVGTAVMLIDGALLSRFESVAPYLELGVGVMLIYLGMSALWNVARGKLHIHRHDHGQGPHVHVHASHVTDVSDQPAIDVHNSLFVLGRPIFRVKSFVIGVVHGLAGSAAVLIAHLPTIDSVWAGFAYIVVFGVGTMLAMAVLTILLALPFKATANKRSLHGAITAAAGALSIFVGCALFAEAAFDATILPY